MLFDLLAAFLILTVGAFAALFLYQKRSKFFLRLNSIPGPEGAPILGHLQFYTQPLDKLFLGQRERARKYFPIYKEWILNVGIVNVLHPDDLQIVLSSTKNINKSKLYDCLHKWLGTGLLTSTGVKWQNRRKILTPAFHFNILKEFVKIFNKTAQKFVEEIEERSKKELHADVVPLAIELTLRSITETAMGLKLDEDPDGSRKEYKKSLYRLGELFYYQSARPWLYNSTVFGLTPQGVASNRCVEVLKKITRRIIQERKDNFLESFQGMGKKKAMLDLLLTAQKAGYDIDDEGIREEVDTFTFEGHDTTAMGLCMILLMLANQKKLQEEIRQEISEVLEDRVPTLNDLQELPLMERFIKESLRLYPSVPVIGRDASEDIETSTGYVIPKGAMVFIPIFDIHRNPEIYPDPERFDPDRFLPENASKRHPFSYIPFSAGPRNCIGQKFAMLELKAVLCGVMRRFALEAVSRREHVKFTCDLVLRPVTEINIEFVPLSLKK